MPSTLPGHRAPSETFFLTTGDGVQLHAEWVQSQQQTGTALVVHGYGEHCGRYRELCHFLAEGGISCLSFDFRGHGRSPGPRGYVKRFSDYAKDLSCAWQHLMTRKHSSSHIVGHSMGGLVALDGVLSQVCSPISLCLSSPFLGVKKNIPAWQRTFGTIASKVFPRFSLSSDIRPEDITHDLQRQQERKQDTLCHDRGNARWYTEALATQNRVADRISQLDIPSLWMIAGEDLLADPETAQRLANSTSGPTSIHLYPSMRHEIFNEVQRLDPMEKLLRYLQAKQSVESN